jgi:hypothetical protein
LRWLRRLPQGALLYIYLGKLEQKNRSNVVYEDVLVAAGDIRPTRHLGRNGNVQTGAAGLLSPARRTQPREAVGFVTRT